MATLKTKISSAKQKVGRKVRKVVAPAVFFLSGLVLISCGEKELTYKDFSGKALKERTLDELQRAKYEMENGYVVMVGNSFWSNDSTTLYHFKSISVPELSFRTESKPRAYTEGSNDPENWVEYGNLLRRIENEIGLRQKQDTTITKTELERLLQNQK